MAGNGSTLSLAVIEEVLDSIKESILMVNREGRVVFYNNACARMDGLNRSDVLGRSLLEVFPSLTRESSILYQVMHTGKPVLDVTQTFTNFKGRAINMVCSSYPIYDRGELWGALEVSRDVRLVWETYEKMIELQAELAQRFKSNKIQTGERAGFGAILTGDESMKKAIAIGRRAARMECPVVVYGETGTGKELFIRAIHDESPRKEGPLVSQNCAALPETLLEAALFGTTRGAFTGAQNRPGLFELADKGTLFLDEVVSASTFFQAKLLRTIEDLTIRRVGGTSQSKVDVRVVASLNIHPKEAISRGLLRNDFFYRLAVMYIELPPLRNRKSDIQLLARHFMEPSGKVISPEAMKYLEIHDWPGNVRELKNLLEGAISLTEGNLIEPEHLTMIRSTSHLEMLAPQEPQRDETGLNKQIYGEGQGLQEMLNSYERKIIEKTLKDTDGNLSDAARALIIPRQTLWSKVKRLSVDIRDFKGDMPESQS